MQRSKVKDFAVAKILGSRKATAEDEPAAAAGKADEKKAPQPGAAAGKAAAPAGKAAPAAKDK
jgi:hypothetical protein